CFRWSNPIVRLRVHAGRDHRPGLLGALPRCRLGLIALDGAVGAGDLTDDLTNDLTRKMSAILRSTRSAQTWVPVWVSISCAATRRSSSVRWTPPSST